MKQGMLAEVVGIVGHKGVTIEAYLARPISASPMGGMIVLHHAPGWDDWSKEVVRTFAYRGYAAICPHLYHRRGPGHWEDIAAAARADGLDKAMPNEQIIGDVEGAIAYLRAQADSNGKVGVIGFCSGGRQAYLAACEIPELNAAIDCWGGSITPRGDPTKPASLSRGVLHRTPDMQVPLLGIFGNDDTNPNPVDIDEIEATLQRLGKSYEFHRYDGAGHAFFTTDRINYRPEQAVDGWRRVFAFCETHLS